MSRWKYICISVLLSMTAEGMICARNNMATWMANAQELRNTEMVQTSQNMGNAQNIQNVEYAQETDSVDVRSEAEKVSRECLRLQAALQAPYYFCDCREGGSVFQFPLDEQISDTVWYTATVDEVRKGLTAYWFADCSVTIEVYALCSAKSPTISMTVGKDQMREMDAVYINKKIDEMGTVAGSLISAVEPHIRVYPNGKGVGHVYVFPYNEGPHSTCATTLPVRPSMTYVSNHTDDVYEWEPDRLPASGSVYVQWKEEKNHPCDVWVTRGSCTGAEVARTTLSDSTKLFFPDKSLIQSAKQAGESLFFHFSHAANKVGRIRFRTNPKFIPIVTDTTVCQGKGLQLADTLLAQTAYYNNDTAWYRGDTVYINAYNLTVVAPEPQRDTLRVKAAQLPIIYRNQEYIAKGGYGDYDFTIHTPDGCDERYLLCVEHLITHTSLRIDTTLCEGKTLIVNGTEYDSDTLIQTAGWTDEDTYADMYISVRFIVPETEYDTVYVPKEEMSKDGYYYAPAGEWIEEYGDYFYTVRKANQCTRQIELCVRELVPSAIGGAASAQRVSTLYRSPEGTLYIVREGKRYNLLGQEI